MLAKGQMIALLVLAVGSAVARAQSSVARELTGTLVITNNDVQATNGDAGVLAPAPPVGLAPEPAPAPQPAGVIEPKVVCVEYMQNTGCGWTKEYNCPGQPAGSKSAAGDDGSDGYKCCCLQGLWQTVVTVPSPTPVGVLPEPVPVPVPSPSEQPGSGADGPVHNGHPIVAEVIPRSIQLKHKLIQWYEDTKQCPLSAPGFPAWAGWKTATNAGPAVTTPPLFIAGNRTMFIRGFCPSLTSDDFTCVKEDGELKARIKPVGRTPTLDLDELNCQMQDISVYRLDNHLGVRFDFTGCRRNIVMARRMQGILEGLGNLGIPGIPAPAPAPDPTATSIKTASMMAGLEVDKVNAAGSNTSVEFTEFMLAVCNGGAPKTFRTALLPKFARTKPPIGVQGVLAVNNESEPLMSEESTEVPQQPSCFSETANSAHVFGKGCYDDFFFFELQDHLGNLAKIPAHNLEALSNLVPKNQHWKKPVPAPAPVPGTPPPSMKPIVVTPGPTPAPKPNDPCTEVPKTTTGTTTPPPVPEVPGVAIVDRICLEWSNCGPCNNLCSCATRPPQGPPISTPTTTVLVPVCEDYQWETLLIAIPCALLSCLLCYWFHDRLVERCTTAKDRTDHANAIRQGTYTPTAGMQRTWNATVGPEGQSGAMMATKSGLFSQGVNVDIRTIEAKSVVEESSFSPCLSVLLDGIICLIICFAVVHAFYWVLTLFFFNLIGLGRDLVWNGIDLSICPLSLFPLCIALWLMNWMCMWYLFTYIRITYTQETVETPVAIEVNSLQQDGPLAWWRFWNPLGFFMR